MVGQGFVEAVESDAESLPQTEMLVRQTIEPIIEAGADVIVLGCTHYPFLRVVIDRVIGDRAVRVIDSGEAVEKRVESLLDEYDMRAATDNKAQYDFITYADEAYAERLRRKAFGE